MKKIVKKILSISVISLVLSPAFSSAADMDWANWGLAIDAGNNVAADCGAAGQTKFQCANAMSEAGFYQRMIVASDGSRYIQTVIADGDNTAANKDHFLDQSFIKFQGGGLMLKQSQQSTSIFDISAGAGTSSVSEHETFTGGFDFSEGDLLQTTAVGVAESIGITQDVSTKDCAELVVGAGGCDVVGGPGVGAFAANSFQAGFTLDEAVNTNGSRNADLHLTGALNDYNGFTADFEMGEVKVIDSAGNETDVVKGQNIGQQVDDIANGFTSNFRIKEVIDELAGPVDAAGNPTAINSVEIAMDQFVDLGKPNANTNFKFLEMGGPVLNSPAFMTAGGTFTTGLSGSGVVKATDSLGVDGANLAWTGGTTAASGDVLIGLRIDQNGGDPGANFGDFSILELINEGLGESIVGGIGSAGGTSFSSAAVSGTDPWAGF